MRRRALLVLAISVSLVCAEIAWAQTNQWINANPTPSVHWMPANQTDDMFLPGAPTVTRPNPVGRPFTGSAMGGGLLFYWGGGHASYPGNDVELYSVASNQWADESYPPDGYAACVGGQLCGAGTTCYCSGVPSLPTLGCNCSTGGPCAGVGGCGTGGVCKKSCDDAPVFCTGNAPTCLVGSGGLSGGSNATKSVWRCAGGTRDGKQCTIGNGALSPPAATACSGGACTRGIPTMRCFGGPTPGAACTVDANCGSGGVCHIGCGRGEGCRPYTEHTYQRQAYNPSTGTFMFVGAGLGTYAYTWDWDPLAGWALLGLGPPVNTTQNGHVLFYDARSGLMSHVVQGTGSGGVYTWNATTNKWAKQAPPPLGNAQAGLFGFWDRNANKFLAGVIGSPAGEVDGPGVCTDGSNVNGLCFLHNNITGGNTDCPCSAGKSCTCNSLSWWLYDSLALTWADVTATAPFDVRVGCSGSNSGVTAACWNHGVTYDVGNTTSVVTTLEGVDSPGYTPALWTVDAIGDLRCVATTTTGLNAKTPCVTTGDCTGGDTCKRMPIWTKRTIGTPPTFASRNTGYENNLHYDSTTGRIVFFANGVLWANNAPASGQTALYTVQLGIGATPTPTTVGFCGATGATCTPTLTQTPSLSPTITRTPTPTATSTPCVPTDTCSSGTCLLSTGTCNAGAACAGGEPCSFLDQPCCAKEDCGAFGVCGAQDVNCNGQTTGVCLTSGPAPVQVQRCIVGNVGQSCAQSSECGTNGWCSPICNTGTPACPSGTSCVPLTPLTDLATTYGGFAGGLYDTGCVTPPCNSRPPGSWSTEGLAIAQQITRRQPSGAIGNDGYYVLLSLGMSNVTQEFAHGFLPKVNADTAKDPGLVVIDGAISNMVGSSWSDDSAFCAGGSRPGGRCHLSTDIRDPLDGCPGGGTCTQSPSAGAQAWVQVYGFLQIAGTCTGGTTGAGRFCLYNSVPTQTDYPYCPNGAGAAQTCTPLSLTPQQVSVLWSKLTDKNPAGGAGGYPCSTAPCAGTACVAGTLCDVQTLRDEWVKIIGIAKRRYPHLDIMYLSPRIYAGYAADGHLNPEPYAYQTAFAVKSVVERQVQGRTESPPFTSHPELDYTRTRCQFAPATTCTTDADCPLGGGQVRLGSCRVLAPWVAWGPYFWGNGVNGRTADNPQSDPGLSYLGSTQCRCTSDVQCSQGATCNVGTGLCSDDPQCTNHACGCWSCANFGAPCAGGACDGVHPGAPADNKVAEQLLEFFQQDQTGQQWYLSAPPAPCAGTVRYVPSTDAATPSQAAAAAQTNDCIFIAAGDYPNDVAVWPATAANLIIKGVPGPGGQRARMTITNGNFPGSKGIWTVDSPNTTIENVEFSCATSRTGNTNCSGVLVGDVENAAGIRLEAPGLTVRNSVFHDNDNSILGGPNSGAPAGDILIENCEFFRNGWGDGESHNLYLNEHNATLTYQHNYSHGAIVGHLLKSRAATNYILYNRIMDEDNGVVGDSACGTTPLGRCMSNDEVQFPCGGLDYVIGNIMQKGTRADSKIFVDWGGELARVPSQLKCIQPLPPTQELYVVNNTFVSDWQLGVPNLAEVVHGLGQPLVNGLIASPLLWVENNLWVGEGDLIMWADPPGTVVVNANNFHVTDALYTTAPIFASRALFDYHLIGTGSAVFDAGADPGTDAHNYSLAPAEQYVYDAASEPRPVNGGLDVGAYEWTGANPIIVATRTPTPSFTPGPTWTPPVFNSCQAGETESVFSIATFGDDGTVTKSGTNYNALGSVVVDTDGYFNPANAGVRRNKSGTYTVQNAFWRWDTSHQPNGQTWPTSAAVRSAFVRPTWCLIGPNGCITASGARDFVFEWHPWTTLSAADWTRDPVVDSSNPLFAASLGPPAPGVQSLALSNAVANVNLAGVTGLRLSAVDATPPALAEDDTAGVRTREWLVYPQGDASTELVVCTTANTPTPGGPTLTFTQTRTITPTPTRTATWTVTQTPTVTETPTTTATITPVVGNRPTPPVLL